MFDRNKQRILLPALNRRFLPCLRRFLFLEKTLDLSPHQPGRPLLKQARKSNTSMSCVSQNISNSCLSIRAENEKSPSLYEAMWLRLALKESTDVSKEMVVPGGNRMAKGGGSYHLCLWEKLRRF
jgi:hypothetical protein